MTLTTLHHAAPGTPTQPASGAAQLGKPDPAKSTITLFGDVAAFAARLEALFSPSPTSAAEQNVTAPVPQPSSSLAAEAGKSAPTPEADNQPQRVANFQEGLSPKAPPLSVAPPIADSVSPVRITRTAQSTRILPQGNVTASQPSRRHLTLQAGASASNIEFPPAMLPSVQAAANPASLPAIPIDTPQFKPADMSSTHEHAGPLPAFGEPQGIETQRLRADGTAAANSTSSPTIHVALPSVTGVSQLAEIDTRRSFATGTPASLPTHETEAPEPTRSPVLHAAASPKSDSAAHPQAFPASVPVNPADLREAPMSDTPVQPPATLLADAQTGIPAARHMAAAPARTTPIRIDATSMAPQHETPPSEPMSSRRVPVAAPQPTLPAETPGVHSPAAQAAATTNLKAQPAAFHSSPHFTDSGAAASAFPASLSAPPATDTRSCQPVPTESAFFNPHSTFAALDAPTPSSAALFTHAGARHAEAGYLDSSLGWVGVRAEVSGGALRAAIVPASSQAADILGAHLPELHAYVSQQHGPESTIDMSWQNQTNADGGFQQSSHQDPYSAADNPKGRVPGSAPTSPAPSSPHALFDAAGMPPPASGSRYISVLA